MKRTLLTRMKRLGLVAVGAFVIAGSPSSSAISQQRAPIQSSDLGAIAQQAHAPLAVELTQSSDLSAPNLSSAALSYDVCAAVEEWQRPSESDQVKQLSGDPRFVDAVEDGALKAASRTFWDHQAISFTTYGLSARMEPMTLSGLWSAGDEVWNCYAPEVTVEINEGRLGEVWLFNQRVVDMAWSEDRYELSVEPATTGVQVVQFERQEQLGELPLDVVSVSGDRVAVVSGDWQE